ncbi:serine/threonine protein kinase [Microbispora sp. NPDC049125]|uniref:serine/threonine protein kinase n=1 Tax=Microbispora sp. NPDC049125 TaxID=3154929 RepID=UPI0034669BCE
MSPVVPLSPEEPATLGPYRLTGRLGPAVFVATSPSGEQVAVKRFPDRRDSRPDPRRVAALREAAPIGTALVLDSGPDYVVTELVDGPSLDETRPIMGAALHRLAIATMTTIAALHQAGIAHGHVRPDQIVLGPDGPRLLCHGSPAPNPAAWRSPEEAAGEPAGPPADLFGWAATMVYAASGREPFAAGSSPGSQGESPGGSPENPDETTSEMRLAHGAADLDPLEGDLRQLVADCLASEPGDRPSAHEALLRLIGHTGALDTVVPGVAGRAITAPAPDGGTTAPGGPPEPARDVPDPAPRRRPSALVLTAAGLAIALASSGAAYALTPRHVVTAAAPGPATTSASARATPSTPSTAASPAASPAMPLTAVHETPSDPVILTSFQVTGETGSTTWARTPSGGFQRAGGDNVFTALSPGGRWLATVNEIYLAQSDRQSITFTDQRSGERFSMPMLTLPYAAQWPAWSRDGKRVLLTVMNLEKGVGNFHRAGFLTVDPVSRGVRFVQTDNAEDVKEYLALPKNSRPIGTFRWTPDGASVAALYMTPEATYGTRFWDLSGRMVRSMHWTGYMIGLNDPFSPSGAYLLTTNCEKRLAVCLWDIRTGNRVATVPGKEHRDVIGWFDDEHVIQGHWVDGHHYRTLLVDRSGRDGRVLAEFSAPKQPVIRLSYTRR